MPMMMNNRTILLYTARFIWVVRRANVFSVLLNNSKPYKLACVESATIGRDLRTRSNAVSFCGR